jgi:hypothetical protein
MKNPLFKGPKPEPGKPDPAADATEVVRRYFESAPHLEEIADLKLRQLHPALSDDKVWRKVQENLSKPAK